MTQTAPFHRSSRKLTRDRITFGGLNGSLTLGLGGLRLHGVKERGISNSFSLRVRINKQSSDNDTLSPHTPDEPRLVSIAFQSQYQR
jgi:hypothetical protein